MLPRSRFVPNFFVPWRQWHRATALPAVISIPAEHDWLWQQISTFCFDAPDAEYPFSRRLAKENKWPYDKARLAIEEYRKFLFLLKVAGHMVTPSVIVDKVWHLHLIYTHSYWVELCEKIMQMPIHHHPGKGGQEDKEKFERVYQRTLNDYAHFFGEPPVKIWGRRRGLFTQARQYS